MNNHPVHNSNPGEPVVFIVDDDAGLRESLGSLLRSIGLRVELFASVAEFMNHPRPDTVSCLVLDVRLQGSSGLISRVSWRPPASMYRLCSSPDMAI